MVRHRCCEDHIRRSGEHYLIILVHVNEALRTRDEFEGLKNPVCSVLCILAVRSIGSPRINYDMSVVVVSKEEGMQYLRHL